MPDALHGTNELLIDGERHLLARGHRVHLVALAGPGQPSRPAVDPDRFDRHKPWQDAYDIDALSDPIWRDTTRCGRAWQIMLAGDGPSISPYGDEHAHVPECRACLRLATCHLTSTPPDNRIPTIVEFVREQLLDKAETRVHLVPGDQVESLRSAIRRDLRRLGFRGNTYVTGDIVYVISDELWDLLPDERRHEIQQHAALSVSAAIFGSPVPPPRWPPIGWDQCGA